MALCWCLPVALVMHFVCISNGEDNLVFQVIGDWGGQQLPPYYTTGQVDVAKQMGMKATEIGASFTLSVGDNFYLLGVTDVDDPRFEETFEVRSIASYKYIGQRKRQGRKNGRVLNYVQCYC